jgi:hypothetical protein
MADAHNSTPVLAQPVTVATQPKLTERELILQSNRNQDTWEWVEIPATDIFDQQHCGVSINFEHYGPDKDAEGTFSGKPGKYFVCPEAASEIRRLLANKMKGDIRVLQPKRDQVAINIMNRNGARIGGQVQ